MDEKPRMSHDGQPGTSTTVSARVLFTEPQVVSRLS